MARPGVQDLDSDAGDRCTTGVSNGSSDLAVDRRSLTEGHRNSGREEEDKAYEC
jgi:hypothetical protein